MKNFFLLLIFLTLTLYSLYGQQSYGLKYEVEAQTTITSQSEVPFWMRANRNGNITIPGTSGSLIGRVNKAYAPKTESTFDWSIGFEGRLNAGDKSNIILSELYGGVRASVFQLQIGRVKSVMGLNGDTSLSSGNFAMSGNALGIPKVEISIPNYYTLPIWEGLIAIKGNFAHGWVGRTDIKDTILNRSSPTLSQLNRAKTYLHQKSLYGRIGKPEWKLKIYGGFNHQVFWGSERDIYGNIYNLSNTQTFFYVLAGKAYGNKDIPYSKIGNQIGSIDVGANYDFKAFTLLVYRQSFYDVGALSKLANIKDGLNGISIENRRYNDQKQAFKWKKLLFEFLYTKNQAGEINSKYTKSGDEDYYNNYFYTKGWSYFGKGLGTPLISPRSTVRGGQASDPDDFFINNRVIAFHFGYEGTIKNLQLKSKLTYSENFGTYGTSPIGHSLGNKRFPPLYGLFKKVNQFSGFIQVDKYFKNGLNVGVEAAVDEGRLLDKTAGFAFKITKSF